MLNVFSNDDKQRRADIRKDAYLHLEEKLSEYGA